MTMEYVYLGMKIFQAVVSRINDVPSENNSFTQKEIIVIPYSSDREVATEYVAIAPSIFPTDSFGSGNLSLPGINQHCIVAETIGARRVQILSYIPFGTTTAFGEYTPVDVTNGGTVFKVGGTNPVSMYFHKGGKWEVYSNEFCRLSLDGGTNSLVWVTDSENKTFAGGSLLNSKEELEGITDLTRHVEVYTGVQEWKQNTDLLIPAEQSVLNPESGIIPLLNYNYVPKVIIRAGSIINSFDTELGRLLGHTYEIETRQSVYANDKDTVSILKLGRQSEQYKYKNSNIYPAGSIFEWNAKTSNITSTNSKITTHLLRFGLLEKDVMSNSVSVEPVEGEIYRNQNYIDIVEPLGAPVVDILAQGRGYEYNFHRFGASQQYSISYGVLKSGNLEENSFFLKNSAVREHFHAFSNHNFASIEAPTGISYDFVLSGENSTENNIFMKKYVKMAGVENSHEYLEQFLENAYKFELTAPSRSIKNIFDIEKYESVLKINENLEINSILQQNLYKNYVKISENMHRTEKLAQNSYEMLVHLENTDYNVKFTPNSVEIQLKTQNETKSPKIVMSEGSVVITPGETAEQGSISIGESGGLQQLVTKAWVTTMFANHIHPTAGVGAPTLTPMPLPEIPEIINSEGNIYTYKIKGE